MNLEQVQIGMLGRHLRQNGVVSLSEIAGAVHDRKLSELKTGRFVYDRYSHEGSSNFAVVMDTDGKERECILWTINHYLGLNRNPSVVKAAQEAVELFGTGCGTSAMSVGLNTLHKHLQSKLEELFQAKSVLIYPTGFTANTGAISTILNRGDLLLFDRESHASIIEGGKSSGAKMLPFRHNDVEDLKSKLSRFRSKYANVLVAVESAYSMSGDLSPLNEIAGLKTDHDFLLYVDEAHSFGFMDERGRGLTYAVGAEDQVDFYVATLSKSAGSKGGFVVCDEKFATYLQCNSSPFIFQACLSPADTAAALQAIELFSTEPGFAHALESNNQYFRKSLLDAGFELGKSQSPIVPVFIPDLEMLYQVSAKLFDQGGYTTPVAYPVVGEKEGRLRFIVNATHKQEDIDHTLSALVKAFAEAGIDDIQGYFESLNLSFSDGSGI